MKIKKYQKGDWVSKLGNLMLQASTTSPTSVTGGDAYGARAMRAFSEGDVETAKDIQREEDTKATMAMGTAAIIPEMAVTGVVPTLVTTAAGLAGGYAGNKIGQYADEKFGTNWIAPTLSIVGGIGGGVGAYKGLKPSYNYLAKNGVIGYKDVPEGMLKLPTTKENPILNVGWAPKQTINVKRAGDLDTMYYPERWDVTNEGANPFGVWLQGKFGVPRTDVTNPGKGAKAAAARKIFAGRKQYAGEVTLEKPMQTVGEIPNRSDLSYAAERMGADGIIYNNVYDNGYNNNQVILSFKKPSIERGYKFYEQPSTYFKDAKYPVSSKSYNGREVPTWQLSKGMRNNRRTSTPIPITLINRTDTPFVVNGGNFVLENPESARRLATVHFTHQEPVTPHMGGDWSTKSTTHLVPYGNVRKVAQPLDIEPMDTFFPNYNGLTFSTKGSKVLTGDKKIFDYYKSNGIDVEYSEEVADLISKSNKIQAEIDSHLAKSSYKLDDMYWKLSEELNAVSKQLADIHKQFAQTHSVKTTFDDMKFLEKIENLPTTIQPEYKIQTEFGNYKYPTGGFTWHSTPTSHWGLTLMSPSDSHFKQLNKQQQKFVEWLQSHKSDYRMQEE